MMRGGSPSWGYDRAQRERRSDRQLGHRQGQAHRQQPDRQACDDERKWSGHIEATCGHVGCCDSSPHRHAYEHFHQVGHPVMRSAEPGENWRWCYIDVRVG